MAVLNGFHSISPYIRVAMDSYIDCPWSVPERVLWDYEILYLKQGELLVTLEDRSYTAAPGDVFIFKPKQRHSIVRVGDSPVRQPHIHFDLFQLPDSHEVQVSFKGLDEMDDGERRKFRSDLLSKPPYELPSYIRLRNTVPFESMLFDLIQEYEMKLPFYELRLKGMFLDLLVHILRECLWEKAPHVRPHLDVLLEIQHYLNHHTESIVSLDDLADKFGFSKYYLNRLFKSAFKMSPVRYHQQAKMEKAKQAIQFTNEPLSRIAERFGYPSIHSFSRAFKNNEGVPPSFYRSRRG